MLLLLLLDCCPSSSLKVPLPLLIGGGDDNPQFEEVFDKSGEGLPEKSGVEAGSSGIDGVVVEDDEDEEDCDDDGDESSSW